MPSDRRRVAGDARATYERTKRAIDLAVSVVLIAAALPVIAAAAIVIWLESPGPIFYRATRVGRHGRAIRVLKFRSMFLDAEARLTRLLDDAAIREEFDRTFKLRNDPRLTRVGRWLRRTSLDEIPQFWNVIIGEMSLVGPRPVTVDELRLYEAVDGGLDAYLSVSPGITGLWQVSGRSNTTYYERVTLDTKYVAERSLWLDLKILARTPFAVLTGDGAF